jgi:hypothetical protein
MDYVVVPACASCNNEKKSRQDSIATFVILGDARTALNSTAKSLFASKLEKEDERGISKVIMKLPRDLRDAITKQVRTNTPEPVLDLAGKEHGWAVPLYLGTILDEWLEWVVQGLYFHMNDGVVHPKSYFMWTVFNRQDLNRWCDIALFGEAIGEFRRVAQLDLNDGAFGCYYFRHQTDPGLAIWFLSFYGGFDLAVVSQELVVDEPAVERGPGISTP